MQVEKGTVISLNEIRKLKVEIDKNIERLSSGRENPNSKYNITEVVLNDNIKSRLRTEQKAKIDLNSAISMAQMQENSINGLYNVLHQIRDLQMRASKDTYNDDQRLAFKNELTSLKKNWEEILNQSTYGGRQLLNAPEEETSLNINQNLASGSQSDFILTPQKPGKIDNLNLQLEFDAADNGKSISLIVEDESGKKVEIENQVISGAKVNLENTWGLDIFRAADNNQDFKVTLKPQAGVNLKAIKLSSNPEEVDFTTGSYEKLTLNIYDFNPANIGLDQIDLSSTQKAIGSTNTIKGVFDFLADKSTDIVSNVKKVRNEYKKSDNKIGHLNQMFAKGDVNIAKEKAKLVANQVRQNGNALLQSTDLKNPEVFLDLLSFGAKR